MTVDFYKDADFLNFFIKYFEEDGFFGDCHFLLRLPTKDNLFIPTDWYRYETNIKENLTQLGYDIPDLMCSWNGIMGIYYITTFEMWDKRRSLLNNKIKQTCKRIKICD